MAVFLGAGILREHRLGDSAGTYVVVGRRVPSFEPDPAGRFDVVPSALGDGFTQQAVVAMGGGFTKQWFDDRIGGGTASLEAAAAQGGIGAGAGAGKRRGEVGGLNSAGLGDIAPASLAAAMIGAIATGDLDGLDDVTAATAPVRQTFTPRSGHTDTYRRYLADYRDAVELAASFRRIERTPANPTEGSRL